MYHVDSADYLIHMETQQAIFLSRFGRFARAGIEFAQPTRMVRLVNAAAGGEGENAGGNADESAGKKLPRLKRPASMA